MAVAGFVSIGTQQVGSLVEDRVRQQTSAWLHSCRIGAQATTKGKNSQIRTSLLKCPRNVACPLSACQYREHWPRHKGTKRRALKSIVPLVVLREAHREPVLLTTRPTGIVAEKERYASQFLFWWQVTGCPGWRWNGACSEPSAEHVCIGIVDGHWERRLWQAGILSLAPEAAAPCRQ